MHRCRLVAWAAPALAVLLATQSAAAGPIGWGYSAEVTANPGGHWVTFGVEYQTTVDPATGGEVSTPYLLMADVGRVSWGTGSDSGTARVGTFGPDDIHTYSTDDPWALTRPSVFTLQFDLTDAASGETRSLSYGVMGGSHGYFTSGTGVVSLTPDERADTFVLGGNRYTVRPVARESESAAYLDVDVTVGPAAAPEPGTLALAVVGLAAVVLRARRWAVRFAPAR
jgi:MYXO-CTERM domain-containing protein